MTDAGRGGAVAVAERNVGGRKRAAPYGGRRGADADADDSGAASAHPALPPTPTSAMSLSFPSAAFQVIYRQHKSFARVTSHRLFADVFRGELQQSSVLQYLCDLVCVFNRIEGVTASRDRAPPYLPPLANLLDWMRIQAVQGDHAGKMSQTGGAADGPHSPGQRADGSASDESDARAANAQRAGFRAGRNASVQARRLAVYLGKFDSYTERVFIACVLLLAHSQAWSLASKLKYPESDASRRPRPGRRQRTQRQASAGGERDPAGARPQRHAYTDLIGRFVDVRFEAAILETQRLLDMQLFTSFASATNLIAPTPDTSGGGAESASGAAGDAAGNGRGGAARPDSASSRVPDTWRYARCAAAVHRDTRWQSMLTELELAVRQALAYFAQVLDVASPSLRYAKQVCDNCGRAGHDARKCMFRSNEGELEQDETAAAAIASRMPHANN